MKESGPPNPKSSPLPLVQAWESLEEAEYRRELALREELIRQEKLEQLARRFDRKAAMRETWLNENQRLVAQVKGAALGVAGEGELSRAPSRQQGWSPRWSLGGGSSISLSTGLAALLPVTGRIKIHI